MKGKFTAYTRSRFKRLKSLLKALQTSDDRETLHQVRIELKKIRALLRLVHFRNKKFRDHDVFKPLKQLHRRCGEIRDPQVIEMLIEEAGEPGRDLVKEHQSRLADFRNDIPAYLEAIRVHESDILKHVRRLKKKTYTKYLKERHRKLKKLVHPKIQKKELHETRKLVKEILFLTLIFKKKKNINPFFQQSAELIGDWHDKAMVIQNLHKNNGAEGDLVADLRRRARKDVKKLRKEVSRFYAK